MTLRSILVPVRGDGKGEGVLNHALSLAKRHSAHLEVLHCRPKPEDMIPYEYAREALKNGLLLAEKLGINPFKFGMVGATDSHKYINGVLDKAARSLRQAETAAAR